MPKIPGLQRRRQGWYVRVRVPKDLENVYASKEVVRSLQTTDYQNANKRIHLERAKIQSEFEEKRQQLKAAHDNPDMLSAYEGHELEGLTLRWLHELQKPIKAPANDIEIAEPDEPAEVLLTLQQDSSQAHREVLGRLEQGEVHYGQHAAALYLKRRGITFNTQSEAFKQLAHLFSKAMYEAAQKELRYWQGKPYMPTDPLFAGGVALNNPGSNAVKKVRLRALLDEYMDDPAKSRGISTEKNYKIIDRLLEEILGADKFVHEITREDAKRVRDLLLKLPSNPTKRAPNKPLEEVIALATTHGWPLMAPATQNMYLDKMRAVFNFAEREGYIRDNPAKGLTVKDTVKRKDKRKPFDIEQLNKIFTSSYYSAKPAKGDKHRHSRFWTPLIGLFTGMRLNEICQLELMDIAQRDGIDVILIREDGETDEKRVKTEAGVRFIPVHPELKKIGFMEFVASGKKHGHKRLFPDLEKDAQGYFSGAYSKWFGRHLHSIEAKKPRTSFHSFRHNFRDALRMAEISRDAALQLGGWSHESVDDDYGAGLPAGALLKCLEKVKYQGLNLSHLHIKT